MSIRVAPHQPPTDRSHQEADGKHRGSIEKLRRLARGWKEHLREVERERGVGVPVVPLDQIADRAAEYGFQAMIHRVWIGVMPRTKSRMRDANARGFSKGNACAAVGTTDNVAPAAPGDEMPTSWVASVAQVTVTTGSRAPLTMSVGAVMPGSFSSM